MLFNKSRVLSLVSIFILSSFVFAQQSNPAPRSDEQEELEQATCFFDEFLYVWLVKQDMDKIMSLIEIGQDTSKWHVLTFRQYADGNKIKIWFRKSLVMWLENDRKRIDQLGRGDPTNRGFRSLPSEPSKLRERLRWEKTSDAVKKSEPLPIFLEGNKYYMVPMRFEHTPNYLLTFLFKKTARGWKIAAYGWT